MGRPDGDYVRKLNNMRRMIPFILRSANTSAVYFEARYDVTQTDSFLAEYSAKTGHRVTYHHLLIWAAVQAIAARPRLNRFVSGYTIYQRKGIWISFSGKKAKTDDHAMVTVKREFDPEWPFEKFLQVINGDIKFARSDKESLADKEVRWILQLPGWILSILLSGLRLLDRWGLMPATMIRSDPLFASMFIANLGSLGMDAGYHHLYEYGNIPLFAVAGKRKLELIVDPKTETARVTPVVTVKFTYDERIEDGLYTAGALDLFRQYFENPQEYMRD